MERRCNHLPTPDWRDRPHLLGSRMMPVGKLSCSCPESVGLLLSADFDPGVRQPHTSRPTAAWPRRLHQASWPGFLQRREVQLAPTAFLTAGPDVD